MTLPTKQQPTIPTTPPHMRPGEVALFRRFLKKDPLPDSSYTFDLHLGQGGPTDPTWPAWLRAMATSLTQKRVDLVAHNPSGWWLLEMKVRAGPGAVGQLLTYRTLFRQQFPNRQPLHLGIVADRNAYDMTATYAQFAIRLFLV